MSAAPVFALSIRQPWAWLILHAGKTVENRRWATSHRGPFLIHASKGMTHAEYNEALAYADRLVTDVDFPKFDDLPRGGIVGRARIVDVLVPHVPMPVRNVVGPEGRFPLDDGRCEHPWHMPSQFGFVLADVTPMPFCAMVGALGFFKVDGDRGRDLEKMLATSERRAPNEVEALA